VVLNEDVSVGINLIVDPTQREGGGDAIDDAEALRSRKQETRAS
jgi:hypothetical protein